MGSTSCAVRATNAAQPREKEGKAMSSNEDETYHRVALYRNARHGQGGFMVEGDADRIVFDTLDAAIAHRDSLPHLKRPRREKLAEKKRRYIERATMQTTTDRNVHLFGSHLLETRGSY